MNFDLSDEQQQLRDAVERFVRGSYGFEFRKSVLKRDDGFDPEVWSGLAELGLLGLLAPEAHGGLGQGPIETALAMQAAGPALLVEPWLDVAVTATVLLEALGDDAASGTLLPSMASGERVVVVAHQEAAGRGEVAFVETAVRSSGDGVLLNGRKAVVPGAGVAHEWLVSARESGDATATTGVSVFRVARGTPGVHLRACATIDGRRAAELTFTDVKLPASARVGAAGRAMPAVQRAYDVTLAAICAEAVGIMQAVIDETVEYLKTRQQFGQPIGRFQALQHRAVEMLVHLEQARSMMWLAALRCHEPDGIARTRALAAAKVVVGQGCRFVAQQAMQLHGGIGMTDELQFSHWFKRLLAIELAFGGTDAQLRRFAHTNAALAHA
ncbi:MAG TPA: acyl-CoA dehydrogenase family protein [Burkholderiaceae bacterium]|nr:acyl-CoA dehydrogenase family protein [Burkholderiaceae bacterium]